ncbi:MAG TPA: ABC transporter permease [Candidatus Acidoferrales bacterium]
METLWQDLRYGVRQLLRSPGFTTVAVLTLALGIGANTAIFSVVNAVLLRPLPAADPGSMVRIAHVTPDGRTASLHSYLDYADYRDQNEIFNGILITNSATALLRAGGTTEQLLAEVVSGDYFAVLGVDAQVGRTFTEADDRAGANPVVVISHHLWQHSFDGNPDVVGQSVELNGTLFTVVGVAPEGFPGLFLGVFTGAWVPVLQASSWVSPDALTNRDAARFRFFGRLRPGVTRPVAQSAMQVVAARLAEAYPETNRGESVLLQPARMFEGQLRSGAEMLFALLLAVVGLVLLAACANLAGLLLVRAGARRREMAVRMALGATRGGLLRQLLTESLLLGILGGAAGLALGLWTAVLLLRFNPLPESIPLRFDLSLDVRVLAFALLLSVLVGVAMGLVPALHASRPAAITALKDEATGIVGGRGKTRLRSSFVVVQVMLSLVLLVTAGLFLRSLENAARIDLGFDPQRALAMDLDLGALGLDEERERQFFRDLLERAEGIPGVRAAAYANLAPLDMATPRASVQIEGVEPPPGKDLFDVSMNRVSAGYFRTLAIPLLAGREFTQRDNPAAPRVAVVNQTFARRFWPRQDPLGRRFLLAGDSRRLMQPAEVTVVGVARDIKYRTLGEEVTPHVYLPDLQHHAQSRTLIVRTHGDPGPMIVTVQREMQQLNPAVQGFFARTLVQHVALAYVPARLTAGVSAVLGLLALLLATIGLYGLVAYSVLLRTREIGIRVALGAQRGDILRLTVGDSGKLVAVGIALGLAGAWALGATFSGLLYGVAPTDPATLATATGLLAVVAIGATWIPARRAARVDPMVALRYE